MKQPTTLAGELRHFERAWIVLVHRALIRPLRIPQIVAWLAARLEKPR